MEPSVKKLEIQNTSYRDEKILLIQPDKTKAEEIEARFRTGSPVHRSELLYGDDHRRGPHYCAATWNRPSYFS